MKANIVVFDIGSTYVKVAAFFLSEGRLHFLAKGQVPTTLSNIMVGIKKAQEELEKKGVLISKKAKKYSSSSAAGGLRMVAMGYMPQVTTKAAKEVAMTAGARVMEVISIEEPPAYRKEVLQEIKPDIILLAGGTDNGDETSALENADIICEVKGKATIIIACNRSVQRKIATKFQAAQIPYVRVPNIMPTIHELNIKPAREAIHEQFIHQITRANGMKEFCESLTDKKVIPTPGAVLLASELLAKGTFEREGIGSLMLIDVGGATTDIHSAIVELEELKIEERGLVINNEKQFSYRTVEGNLGIRVSATGIVEAVNPRTILHQLDRELGINQDDIVKYTDYLEQHTAHISQNEKEACIDRALATCAVHVAIHRHAGIYAKKNDVVTGVMAGTAIGRDVRYIKYLLCVGGIFAHSKAKEREAIIAKAFANPGNALLPIVTPQVLYDKEYILFALGVLASYHPEEVLNYMLREWNN